MPSSPGQACGLRAQCRQIEAAIGRERQHAGRRAAVADAHRQRARVHASQAGDPARPQPGVQVLRRAPVRRLGNVLLHHQAACGDGGGLDVLGVGADVADMREGEGDDLAGIGRVGQRLLVAGHAGVEADLAHGRGRSGMRAEAAAPEHRSIGQHERGGGAGRHLARVGAGLVSGRGKAGPPGRSDNARPVAAITAAQWRDGIDPAWRHLRTASVPTPVRRAAASAPPRRSMTLSTSMVMAAYLWELTSQDNSRGRVVGIFFRQLPLQSLRLL